MERDLQESLPSLYPVHWLNFDPDAFIDEIVNVVIEISMRIFTEIELCATRLLNFTGEESLAALAQGLSAIFEKFLSKLIDEDFAQWERYCREVCFRVPEGLVLPEKFEVSTGGRGDEEAKLDAELLDLRKRKMATEKEAAKVQRDIRAIEAHLEARGNFIDAFEQLQNLPLVDDLGPAVRELREKVEEANALRTQRFQKLMAAPILDPELGAAGECETL